MTADETPEPPQLTFSLQTLKEMFIFAKQSIKQTKQRIEMTKIEKIGGDHSNPLIRKKQRLIDRIRMQPHIKLLILDQINFFLSLLSDSDRKAMIGDLTEQQRVLDAKIAEEKGGSKAEDGSVIDTYMQKKDDLEFRTLQELNH